MYFQRHKPPKHKRLWLSEDETELWCGKFMYISLQDVEEVRLGQNTHVFDKQKKFADNLDKWSFSIMFGKRGKYGMSNVVFFVNHVSLTRIRTQ